MVVGQPPTVTRLLETALYVEDLDRARGFYERVFGFAAMVADTRLCALRVPGGGVLLLFRRGASVTPAMTPGGRVPPHDGQGALHLAFAVPVGELEGWVAHLAAHDVAVESRVVWPRGGTSLYMRDPDGHSVELATPGLWPDDGPDDGEP